MKAATALLELKSSLATHNLPHWTGKLDNARRRFGVCRMNSKQISISRYLCELNTDAEVRDTILHEIAHALAWERHGENCGHDKRWQAICVEIGARPVACFDDEVIQPRAPWALVNRESGEVYRTYYKRPTRDWSKVWIRGRKAETHGKLQVRANTATPKTGDLFSHEEKDKSETPEDGAPASGKSQTPVIEQFNEESVSRFRKQLLEHVEKLTREFGLEITGSKGRYGEKSCDLTLSFRVPTGESDEDIQRLEFESIATAFEVRADQYLSSFSVNGKYFKLIGFKPNNRKYPVIGIDESGQKYKFEATVLDQIVEKS